MTKILNERDFFKTADLSLASSLRYYGYIVEAIDRQNPKKVEFLFIRDNDLDKIIHQFWSRLLTVEPVAYFGFIKELKNRLYSE